MCISSKILRETSFTRATMNQQFTSCALGECGSYLFFEVQIFNPDILFRLFGAHVAFCLHIYICTSSISFRAPMFGRQCSAAGLPVY